MGNKRCKKVNPRRRPANQADVIKAKSSAVDEAITAVWSIIFTVLRDKEGYSPEQLSRIWDEVNDLSDSISRGYVNVTDLRRTLDEEAGITLS